MHLLASVAMQTLCTFLVCSCMIMLLNSYDFGISNYAYLKDLYDQTHTHTFLQNEDKMIFKFNAKLTVPRN